MSLLIVSTIFSHISEDQTAHGGAQHGTPEIFLVGHEDAVQGIPGDFDDVPAERVYDIHQIGIVTIDDLQKKKKPKTTSELGENRMKVENLI